MEHEKILRNLVRIGTVTAVDQKKRRARAKFQDSGITSHWLYIVQAGAAWLPKVNDTVLVIYLPVFNGDGFILGVI